MRIKTYALSVVVMVLFLSSGTDKANFNEGFRPGNIAPGIKLLEVDADIEFTNDSGHYTLLHFWAAYDGESRMRNVQLWNKLKQDGLSHVKMISISMDELQSVFAETVKADKLEMTTQLHEKLGERSDVYKKYGLKKGFRTFLIDDRGVIVAINVTPDKLRIKN